MSSTSTRTPDRGVEADHLCIAYVAVVEHACGRGIGETLLRRAVSTYFQLPARLAAYLRAVPGQLDGVDVDRVFTDRASGKDTARPKLDELIAFVRNGNTVMMHSVDRLARNLDDLRRLVRTLIGKDVRVEFVKENLTFTGEDSPGAPDARGEVVTGGDPSEPFSIFAHARWERVCVLSYPVARIDASLL